MTQHQVDQVVGAVVRVCDAVEALLRAHAEMTKERAATERAEVVREAQEREARKRAGL